MNFFDLRNALISLGLTPNGKYELKSLNEIYPTYSVQGLLKAEYEYNISDYPNFTMLDIMKNLSEDWLPVYKQITGKNVEINSVAGYVKMMSELVNMVQNLKWEIDIHYVPTVDKTVHIESDDYTNYILVDWGDGAYTQTNADITSADHTYAEEGDYHITVTLNRIGYLQDFLAILGNINSTIFIIDTVDTGIIKKVKWPLLYTYSLFNNDAVGTAYYFTSVATSEGATQMYNVSANDMQKMVIGDSSLPYVGSADWENAEVGQQGQGVITDITVQVIGANFSTFTGEYTALTTLKVAPDDLKTFKTAVTAFNKGNTTATLTVLKGKNQEEAYQWATANGHFANIVKE